MKEETSMADTGNMSNDFRTWVKSLGLTAKPVAQAGEMIGMTSFMAGRTARGERDLTETERLAMAAVTAGLPAWSPETAEEIEAVRTLYQLLKAELSSSGTTGGEIEAVRTVKALIRSEAARIAASKIKAADDDSDADQAILALLRSALSPQNSSAN